MTEMQVRDRVVDSLVRDYGYSPEQMEFEVTFERAADRRAIVDLIIYESADKIKPHIVVEFKKRLLLPVMISQLEDYMIYTHAEYGLLTDNMNRYCLRFSKSGDLLQIPDIPRKDETDLEYPRKDRFQTSGELELTLRRIINILRVSKRIEPLDELNKILLCKLTDEYDSSERVQFWVTQSELSALEDPDQFLERMQSLLDTAVDALGPQFTDVSRFKISIETLKQVVSILQNHSISSDPHVAMLSYNHLISSYYKASRKSSHFHIPDTLTHLIVELLRPSPEKTFLDPACNAGELLSEVVHWVNLTGTDEKKIDEFPRTNLFGAERTASSSLIAKIILLMHEADGSNIHAEDILKPGQSTDESAKGIGGFDLIGSARPLGRVVRNEGILKQYQVSRGRKQFSSVGLLIERCFSLLKSSGRIAIVVPENFMFDRTVRIVRDFILNNFILKAIISLPPALFKPFSSIKTNLLLLEKPENKPTRDYSVFVTSIKERDERSFQEQVQKLAEIFHQFDRTDIARLKGAILIDRSTLRDEDWVVATHQIKYETERYTGVHLSKVAQIFSGIAASSKDYTDDPQAGSPYVRVGDLANGSIIATGMKRIKLERISDEKRLRAGDVLVSLTGTIGKVSVTPKTHVGAIPSSLIAVIRPNKKKVRSEYLVQILSTKRIQSILQKLDTGSTISHLRISNLRVLKVPIPSLEEQDSISKQVKALQEEYTKHLRETHRIERELSHLREEIWIEHE